MRLVKFPKGNEAERQKRQPSEANMNHELEKVLLRPGDTVRFRDRDDLLEVLDNLEQRVPARHEGRTKDHREHFCILRYLRFLAGGNLLPLPATLKKSCRNEDPPDFILEPDRGPRETFELTDGSTEEYQKKLSAVSRGRDRLVLPVDINMPTIDAAHMWAEILFAAFRTKTEGLLQGRFNLDHLLIYDLTGLNLLVPVEVGAPLLKQGLLEWHTQVEPTHRFGRISVLRDNALLLDAGNGGKILCRESTYFKLPVILADDERDLRKRLREIDHFCRINSIRYLKALGAPRSAEDSADEFDIDLTAANEGHLRGQFSSLLVEFEPGAHATRLDMSRIQGELSELLGFDVNLHLVS